MEWQFRSNSRPVPFPGCDARLHVQYQQVPGIVDLHGDMAISFNGTSFVLGLDPSQFHTYRFESYDTLHYTVSVDGGIFIDT
ncbi:MAG: hypothetical protein ACYTGQ_14670, partial [Planctomycetota bacterium]